MCARGEWDLRSYMGFVGPAKYTAAMYVPR